MWPWRRCGQGERIMSETGVRYQVSGVRGMVGVALVLAAFVAGGCGKKSDLPVGLDAQIVASVNGVTMTQADLDRETDMRMEAMKGRMPEDRRVEGRKRIEFMVVDQFVVRTLLLAEAEKEGMTAPEEELQEALAKAKANLPPGQTYAQVVAKSPGGEAGLLEELTTGLKINKLLEVTLKDKLVASEEEIAAFTAQNKERLQRPERVRARHILIKTTAADDEATKAAAKAQTDGLRQKLVDGGDFAALAAEHSSCPSKQQGGDLGFFTRGRMAKPFEEAAFSQEVDALGPVVETQFGYHIIQVTEKQAAGIATPEEVAKMLKQRKQQEAIRTYVQSLRAGADITVRGRPIPEEGK